ncbi:beta-lactamase/transpeptidase-like protein [Rhexocercosporidium sp. MPI-PUGE-AT-0058]|nr:beta-lactamase/transpeptidase-like protein [Rhexocercosporidium sp. MPI-PUGE-AT-0058]
MELNKFSYPIFFSAIAAQNITELLNKGVSGELKVAWVVPNVSFSIAVISIDTPDSKIPLWEYHHLASGNVNGTKTVDGDSQYLMGSISKLFTDLILLRTGLSLDDPVTKYLPDLESEDSPIRWGNITLESLGNPMAGIPPTHGYPEIYDVVYLYELLGFPKLPKPAWSDCGIIGLNPGCTRQQLLENMNEIHPVSVPFLRPSYSSHSFTILSYALQNATGRNYTQLLQNLILDPLNMTNTGLFSTTHDLSTLLLEILSPNPTLLTRSQMNAWLKPHSMTSDPNTLVGLPWEIYRAETLTPAHPHAIDIYTKSGGAFGYAAILGVIEQYGLGFAILTAGGKGVEAQNSLEGTLMRVLMPVIEEVTRLEASDYVGNYTNDSDGMEASLEIAIDDGPGLRVTELTRNGSDMLDAFHTLWNAQPVGLGNLTGEFRLYPTDVTKGSVIDGKMEEFCTSWQTSDAILYAGESADRFVFVRDMYGEVIGVQVPSLRLNLTLSC